MGYLIKVSRHVCYKPDDGMAGDVWQCDYCETIYIKFALYWVKGYQSINGKYYTINEANLERNPRATNDKDDE